MSVAWFVLECWEKIWHFQVVSVSSETVQTPGSQPLWPRNCCGTFRRWPTVDYLLMKMRVVIVWYTEFLEIAIQVCRVYSGVLVMTQSAKCSHCKCKDLSSIPRTSLEEEEEEEVTWCHRLVAPELGSQKWMDLWDWPSFISSQSSRAVRGPTSKIKVDSSSGTIHKIVLWPLQHTHAHTWVPTDTWTHTNKFKMKELLIVLTPQLC